MYSVMKIFILAAAIMAAAFFANLFGIVSIPWLDVNSVPTYGDSANQADQAARKALED
jgi:4-amino-4-deoxy-L-arabinose transferase-like glycosyltransferase